MMDYEDREYLTEEDLEDAAWLEAQTDREDWDVFGWEE